MLRKGTKVRVRAVVKGGYPYSTAISRNRVHPVTNEWVEPEVVKGESRKNERCLMRFSSYKNFIGMVVGKSYRMLGFREQNGYREPNTFGETERVPVWMVVPLKSDRYIKPYAVLEEDLEVI